VCAAIVGENLDRAVPTAAQRERFAKASKSRKKKTTTKKSIRAKQKKTKKTTKKSNETRGADPNLTDEQGNTALHAFAAMGLRQVVVALMLSGADVTARNDDGRLPLSLLPEYELVLLEKNAALLPATSATRHLLQSLLALHHHHEAA
jgi:ankyrin repeat protein